MGLVCLEEEEGSEEASPQVNNSFLLPSTPQEGLLDLRTISHLPPRFTPV